VRKIYVVNDSGHDFTAARSYDGEMIVLTTGKVNIFATDRIKNEMEEKMSDAESGDLILLSGNAILNVLASLAFLSKTGEISFLIFNFNTEKYEKRKYGLKDFKLSQDGLDNRTGGEE